MKTQLKLQIAVFLILLAVLIQRWFLMISE